MVNKAVQLRNDGTMVGWAEFGWAGGDEVNLVRAFVVIQLEMLIWIERWERERKYDDGLESTVNDVCGGTVG